MAEPDENPNTTEPLKEPDPAPPPPEQPPKADEAIKAEGDAD